MQDEKESALSRMSIVERERKLDDLLKELTLEGKLSVLDRLRTRSWPAGEAASAKVSVAKSPPRESGLLGKVFFKVDDVLKEVPTKEKLSILDKLASRLRHVDN